MAFVVFHMAVPHLLVSWLRLEEKNLNVNFFYGLGAAVAQDVCKDALKNGTAFFPDTTEIMNDDSLTSAILKVTTTGKKFIYLKGNYAHTKSHIYVRCIFIIDIWKEILEKKFLKM